MRYPLKIFLVAIFHTLVGVLVDGGFLIMMGVIGVNVCLNSFLWPVTRFQRFFFSEYIK